MKQKITALPVIIFLIFCVTTYSASAQRTERQLPVPEKKARLSQDGNYTYKLYTAPGNAFGYDILREGKPVFHQFVIQFITKEGKCLTATKQQAETAAGLAIGKIKKGDAPLLSAADIRQAMAVGY